MKIRIGVLLFFILASGIRTADFLDAYKKGNIHLEADSRFGHDVDWEELVHDENRSIAVTPGGDIFVANSRQHNIYKFNSIGKHVLTFGQKGNGPGDVYHPGDISVLDGKFLVVGEYAEQRRLSVFDLNGKFVRVLKTGHPVFSPIGLINGKIAYMYSQADEKLKTKQTIVVVIDSGSGKEQTVCKITSKYDRTIVSGTLIKVGNFKGTVFLARSAKGNLLVGVSNAPVIKTYSPEGLLLETFRLSMKPLPVTGDFIHRYKQHILRSMKNNPKIKKRAPFLIQKVSSMSFKPLFDDHLPYYYYLTTDGGGNILVFKTVACLENCQKVFQVYSPGGKYICETAIDDGVYKFKLTRYNKNLVFSSNGIFGLFSLKNSGDVSLRVVKLKLD